MRARAVALCLAIWIGNLAFAHAAVDAVEARLQLIERLADRHPTRAAREFQALTASGAPLDERARLRMDVARVWISGALDSPGDTLAMIERTLPALRSADDAGLLAKALVVQARTLDFLNRGADALEASAAAYEQAQRAANVETQIEALVDRAGFLAARSDFRGATSALESAEQMAARAPSQRAIANVAYYNGWLAGVIGDHGRAVDMFRLAVSAYRADDDLSNAADTLAGLGIALIRNQRSGEALEFLSESVRLFEQLDDERGVAIAEAPRAVALASAGRSTEALAASDRSLRILRPHRSGEELLFALLWRAQMANLLARSQLALDALAEVRPHAEKTENALARIRFLRESATALAAAGRHRDANLALEDLMRRESDFNDQRLSRQLAAQRGQLESQRLAQEVELLRREADAGKEALAAAERASRLQVAVIVLGAALIAAALYGLWHQVGARRRMAALAALDHLTGTLNRRRISELGQQSLAACRDDGRDFSVLLLDLDHFKRINDQSGHAAGDRALQVITTEMKKHLREADHLGRYGGEEFAVVLPGADTNEAHAVAERLRVAVAALPASAFGADNGLTLSGGIAVAHANDADFAALIERADRALYRAKDAGRDRIEVAQLAAAY